MDINYLHVYIMPHQYAAIKCLQVGYRDNAVSWMWRDIGEIDNDPGKMPHPDSLCIINGKLYYQTCQEYTQGLMGDGI